MNLWSTMKKRKLLTWKDSAKVLKVPCKDKVVELQEDRSLFARLMVVCKSRPEVDVKKAIGRYEFSVVPRSLFAADDTMLHCPAKSTLMRILETHGGDPQQTTEAASGNNVDEIMNFDMEPLPQMRVAVVDAMAELQCIDKPEDIKNISQLAEHFNKRITKKFQSSDEVRLIFDRFDLPSSLKTATRVRRQAGEDPVFYRITDSTHIAKVPMRRLLSHTETKKELPSYLGKKFFDHAKKTKMRVVVAYGNECQGTHEDVAHLQSTQEEADTKIVLHALDAASNGATQLLIYSPDTDVLVLCLRRYPELCVKTSFVTGTGQNRREIELGAISSALGSSKLAALPAFHALSGADVTGSFSGKGKPACWKVFKDADEDVVNALGCLGTTLYPEEKTVALVEKFVCQIYQPPTSISNVKDLRWQMFKKNQAQSDRLPPTLGALYEAILRTHYQMIVWNKQSMQSQVAKPRWLRMEERG